MDLKILFGFLVYWSLIFLFFGGLLSGSMFDGYTTTGQFNSTYTDGEIDIGGGSIFGFFDAIGVVFTTLGRLIALIFFGLTPILTGSLQILFSVWETLVTMFFIGFIINSIWSG